MTAGEHAALDAEIAARVMGRAPSEAGEVPPYSRDIGTAWAVVERCTAIGPFGYREVNGLPVATWFMAHFERAALWSMPAADAAEAICRAALAATEGRPVRRIA